jgi:hypothetical protein
MIILIANKFYSSNLGTLDDSVLSLMTLAYKMLLFIMCPANFGFGPRIQNAIHPRHTPTDLRRQSAQGSGATDSTSDEWWCDSLLGQKIDLVCTAFGPALGPLRLPNQRAQGSFLRGKTIGA